MAPPAEQAPPAQQAAALPPVVMMAPPPGMELMAQAIADAAAKKAERERAERERALKAATEANDAAAKAMAAAAEAEEEWMEASDLFLSPSGNGGALPLATGAATARGGGVVMPRLSFFLRTPEQGKAGKDADHRRVSYAFKAPQQDQKDVEAWLNSESPVAMPRKLGGGLNVIDESGDAPPAIPDVSEPDASAAPTAPSEPAPARKALGLGGVRSTLRAPPTRVRRVEVGLKAPAVRASTAASGISKPTASRNLATAPAPTTTAPRASNLKRPSMLPGASTARTQLPLPGTRINKRPTKP